MRVIISHDIDHIDASDHCFDLFLVKYFLRNAIELMKNAISWKEFYNRNLNIFKNKFNNINELVAFDKANNVNSTFFLAVRKGIGLSYRKKKANMIAQYLINMNMPVGVHGISFNDYDQIYDEKSSFTKMTGLTTIGIRMHYLRLDVNTLEYLCNAGYSFDSSVYSLEDPYKIKHLWEFPIHIMDTYIFYSGSRFQLKSLQQLKNDTIQLIEKAESSGINYLNIITHDFYFSDAFENCKKWYIWLISYLNSKGFESQNYKTAIEKLNIPDSQAADYSDEKKQNEN